MTETTDEKLIPRETIIRAESKSWDELSSGVSLRLLASGDCGAKSFCTALATFAPMAALPYHIHDFSEALTVLSGTAAIGIQGRTYLLGPLDCMHIPRLLPHIAANASAESELKILTAFGHRQPTRTLVDGSAFPIVHYGRNNSGPGDPEHVQRFTDAEKYELAPGTQFFDLFAGRFGAIGICGGYGEFSPGSSLPCHIHEFDESVTIISGEARCEAEGRCYYLSGCDTAFIPGGRPRRFMNVTEEKMAMIWVCAANEPARTQVETGYCTGDLSLDEPEAEGSEAME